MNPIGQALPSSINTDTSPIFGGTVESFPKKEIDCLYYGNRFLMC